MTIPKGELSCDLGAACFQGSDAARNPKSGFSRSNERTVSFSATAVSGKLLKLQYIYSTTRITEVKNESVFMKFDTKTEIWLGN
jgi:hypothetical protein